MKVARFLLAHALLLALAGAATAQMPPGPVSMDPGAMMPGPSSYGPNGAEALGADCYPAPMAGGPVYGDCMPGCEPGGRGRLLHRTGRGYVQIDAVMLNRNDATGRVIAFNNGGVNTATTGATIISASDPNFGFETLPRITAGYTLMNDIAVEGTVWYKDDFDAIYDGFNPTGTTGQVNSNIFAFSQALSGGNTNSNFTDADIFRTMASTGIHSYEINVVETTRVFNFIAGFRYMEVRDQFRVYATDSSGVNPSNGTSLSQFGTYNHLMGTQFGVKTGFTKGLATLDTSVKAGLYLNDAQSTTNIRDFNNTAQQRNTHLGGQNEAFVGEFNVNLTVRVAASTALRLGYQCMFINQVALSVDQINAVDSAQTGLSLNAGGDLFLHGPSAGLDFRW